MNLDEDYYLAYKTSTSDVVHVTWNVVYQTATGSYMPEASKLVACNWLAGEVDPEWPVKSAPPLYGRRYITSDDLYEDPTMRPTCLECLMHLEAALEMSAYQRYPNGP